MSKHTPAPWFVNESGTGVNLGNIPSIRVRQISGPMGQSSSVQKNHQEELEANARLIASAPELAEALRELHDFALVDEHYLKNEQSKRAFAMAAELLKRVDF